MVSVLSQFDSAIDRTGKLVTLNWSEQLKVRKLQIRSQRVRSDHRRSRKRANYDTVI